MASFNKVIIAGNLTRDPEMRVTPKGTPLCQFSLALNHKFKTESGEQREEVTYVECEAWGKTAELIAKYLGKGRSALVEGRLKLDQWEDKQTNQKRQRLKVVVESVQFLGSPQGERGQSGGDSGERHSPPPPRGAPTQNKPQPGEPDDSDVPF